MAARKKKLKPGFSTFKDARGKFRWRVVDPDNFRIIGASSQGYTRRRDAIQNADDLGVLKKWPEKR